MILLPNMYIPCPSCLTLTNLWPPPEFFPLYSDPLYKPSLFLYSPVLPTFSALQSLSVVLAPRLLSGILILIMYYLFYLYLTKSIYLAEWVASQGFWSFASRIYNPCWALEYYNRSYPETTFKKEPRLYSCGSDAPLPLCQSKYWF